MVPVSTRRPARVTVAALAAAVAVVCAPAARAQSVWLDHDHRSSGLVEVLFPTFDGADTKFPDWTWYATGRFPLGGNARFVGELPFTQLDLEGGGDSHSTIGNPYLGIEAGALGEGMLIEFGLRLPLASDASDSPWVNGFVSDIDREEAFVPDALPLRLGVHYRRPARPDGALGFDLRLVPSALIKTNDEFLASNQTFLGYGGIARYAGRSVRAAAGLTGRWNLTNADEGFGPSSLHQAEFALDFLPGSVRPGVQLKLPLDQDLRQVIDKSWGVTLTVLPAAHP